jgi:hypothetical protein
MKMALRAAFGLVALFSLGGCATVWYGRNTLPELVSYPTNADISTPKGFAVGQTPSRMGAKGDAVEQLVVSKEGYLDAKVSVVRDVRFFPVLLDALFLCIPCFIDDASNAATTVTLFPDTVRLVRKLSIPEQAPRLALLEPAMDAHTTFAYSLNGSLLKPESMREKRLMGIGSWECLGSLQEAFSEQNLDAPLVDATKPLSASGADLCLRPRVLWAKGSFAGGSTLRSLNGSGRISVEWEVLSGYASDSSSVALCRLETPYSRFSQRQPLLADQLRESARHLLSIDTLWQMLNRAKAKAQRLAVGEKVMLKTPIPIAFSSFKEALRYATEAVVTIETSRGLGSGFFVAANGMLLTNQHVVEDQANVIVRLKSGAAFTGKVLKRNTAMDLALVQIPADSLPCLSFAPPEAAEIGDDVWAIGTPLEKTLNQTVTKGIISGIREVAGKVLLQTDVSINPGNSGGPLIDQQGRVVGITTMKMSGKGIEGLSFGIPVRTAAEGLNLEFK